MRKIGLAAAGGALPIAFAKAAKETDCRLIVLAVKDLTSPEIEKYADKITWIKYGQYGKFIFFFLKERVKEVVFLGKVARSEVNENDLYDENGKEILSSIKDKKDYSILAGVTKHLKKIGISVISPVPFLKDLIPEEGILTDAQPDEMTAADISFGMEAADKMADADIGQTVIVKDRALIAVEAAEGTDSAIRRGYELAGEGCVMIKTARSNQDMRWDVPTVGPDTMDELIKNRYKALAINLPKCFL